MIFFQSVSQPHTFLYLSCLPRIFVFLTVILHLKLNFATVASMAEYSQIATVKPTLKQKLSGLRTNAHDAWNAFKKKHDIHVAILLWAPTSILCWVLGLPYPQAEETLGSPKWEDPRIWGLTLVYTAHEHLEQLPPSWIVYGLFSVFVYDMLQGSSLPPWAYQDQKRNILGTIRDHNLHPLPLNVLRAYYAVRRLVKLTLELEFAWKGNVAVVAYRMRSLELDLSRLLRRLPFRRSTTSIPPRISLLIFKQGSRTTYDQLGRSIWTFTAEKTGEPTHDDLHNPYAPMFLPWKDLVVRLSYVHVIDNAVHVLWLRYFASDTPYTAYINVSEILTVMLFLAMVLYTWARVRTHVVFDDWNVAAKDEENPPGSSPLADARFIDIRLTSSTLPHCFPFEADQPPGCVSDDYVRDCDI